jgi:ferric-dicitrate binding protein FerR (iron transport regulator)
MVWTAPCGPPSAPATQSLQSPRPTDRRPSESASASVKCCAEMLSLVTASAPGRSGDSRSKATWW